MNKKAILIILDGWGYREEKEHNAIAEANTPCFDSLWQNNPHCLLEASGEAVGLPAGQMGNSEVGHMVIGSGKVIATDLVRISHAAINGQFDTNPAFQELFNHVRMYDSVLHIKGLIGPGGVHAHSDHLFAFLRSAKKAGIEKVAIHAFTDGRDTAPQSAAEYIKELEDVLEEVGIGFIATASGRYYAMDRDKNWDRLAKVEEAIFNSNATKSFKTKKPSEIITKLHKEGITDEHMEPIVFLDENGKTYSVGKNDGIFLFNFRADRARQISKRITDRKKELNLCYVTMAEYDPALDCLVAFPPETIETTLATEVSKAGLSQVHIAETEKYAHVTYYLNGGRETSHENEEHILVDSRKDVKTHDEAPKMRALEITDAVVGYIEKDVNFIAINFANPDILGHTAKKDAIIEAIETLDDQLKTITEKAIAKNYKIVITADHGNAEINIDENERPHTAHSTNPVPCIVIGAEGKMQDGTIADIAPTVLDVLGISIPKSMTGKVLIK